MGAQRPRAAKRTMTPLAVGIPTARVRAGVALAGTVRAGRRARGGTRRGRAPRGGQSGQSHGCGHRARRAARNLRLRPARLRRRRSGNQTGPAGLADSGDRAPTGNQAGPDNRDWPGNRSGSRRSQPDRRAEPGDRRGPIRPARGDPQGRGPRGHSRRPGNRAGHNPRRSGRTDRADPENESVPVVRRRWGDEGKAGADPPPSRPVAHRPSPDDLRSRAAVCIRSSHRCTTDLPGRCARLVDNGPSGTYTPCRIPSNVHRYPPMTSLQAPP